MHLYSKKMLGCFNPILGQNGQTQTLGYLKMKPNGWVCPYLTQNWVKTTQHF